MKKIGIAMAAALLFVLSLAGCTNDSDNVSGSKNKVGTAYADKKVGFQLDAPAEGEEIAIMHTTKGDIKIRFFPEAAPKAVENFKTHAKNGYFDGLTFHRVINDFMIQGGDPSGNGTGGKSIWGNAFEDEFDQKLLNLRGSLAMANSGVNTNGSQFFINQAPAKAFQGKKAFEYDPKELEQQAKETYQSYLQQYGEDVLKQNGINSWKDLYEQMKSPTVADWVPEEVWDLYGKTGGNLSLDGAWRASGGHTVFGQVFDGMDIVDTIAAVKTDENDKPVDKVLINSIDIVKYSK